MPPLFRRKVMPRKTKKSAVQQNKEIEAETKRLEKLAKKKVDKEKSYDKR